MGINHGQRMELHTSPMNFSYCIAPMPIAPIKHQKWHRRHIFPMRPNPKIHRWQAIVIAMIFHLPMTPDDTSLVHLNKIGINTNTGSTTGLHYITFMPSYVIYPK
jgi:hypothetical protein